MKFQEGANKFRILSEPIFGYEGFIEENDKPIPVRSKNLNDIADMDWKVGGEPKYFWALVVWDYKDKAVKILEIKQKTILRAIFDYEKNEEWGDTRKYDLTVTRTGEKLDTSYTIMASPHKPLSAEIKEAYEAESINLNALYDNGNPFGKAEGLSEDTTDEGAEVDPDSIPEF
jgi:hypothetical protein